MAHHILTDQELEYTLETELRKQLPHSAIVASVRESVESLYELLSKKTKLIIVSPNLQFPFNIGYKTPETLGADRLANAAGAWRHFGNKNCLVVDCGTCITYTLINSGSLEGGAISPGLKMRLAALNEFTGKLPLVSYIENWPEMVGRTTENAILSGVLRAIIIETDGMISQYCSEFSDLTVILTGGMQHFFEAHLKSPIFAAPFLTPEGLHEILLLNEN